MIKKMKFTDEQEFYICYVIGEWYIEWVDKIVNYDNKTHRLGFAKEKLKEMLCSNGEQNND